MIITSGHISHGQMMALWHLAQNFRSWPSSALKTMVFQQFAMEHGPFIWYTLWFTLIFIPIEQCWFYSYIYRVWNSFRIFFWAGLGFFLDFLDFLAGTICLVFATVWNLNLSFCMVFATFGHVHLPFCMGFTTCGHVHLPFCMVFATFWHVHLPFCMGCSTCEHVHPNIYRCGSLGLDKKRVGGIEGGH